MRFILFNAAVIAALVSIYSAERGAPLSPMDRLDAVFATADVPADPLPPAATEPKPMADPLDQPVMEQIAEAPVTIAPQEPPAAPADAPVAEPAEVPVLAPLEEKTVAEVPVAAPRALPPVSDPAVAKRRREILEGLDEAPTAALADAQAPVVLADGESLMSNRERITELHRLAEEMELLFVESLAK